MANNHTTEYKIISQKIKYYRNEKNLTQENLSQKSGISKSYLSKIESQNCDKSFSIEILFQIAQALNIPPYYLLKPNK